MHLRIFISICILLPGSLHVLAQQVTVSNAGMGWAGNSINTTVFRKNSLTTHGDTQFISYYNGDGYVMLGKRNVRDSTWMLHNTGFRGNILDAHNIISIVADGDGYLHMAWDHHNNPLHYSRSVTPLSLEMSAPAVMAGSLEDHVTYPGFYRLPDGNLLFLYRDGVSGNGNLVLNQYDTKTKTWSRLHSNLIDGEGQRNAYWQAWVDDKGAFHLSWVWRETPDVASNHDLCYAVSTDGGKTWHRSNGTAYTLPITEATAEVVVNVPQKSELINQTSMCTDDAGNPIIASYWNGKGGVPQYHVAYLQGGKWIVQDLAFRKQEFSLSGTGTRKIPISRPQIVCKGQGKKASMLLVFRDVERGERVSAALSTNWRKNKWKLVDLHNMSVGQWEPTFDAERWRKDKVLSLLVQQVSQADAEGVTTKAPQLVGILEYKF